MKITTGILLWTISLFFIQCSSPVELSDKRDWYVFQPENNHGVAGPIGLQDWNDEPAGKYGRILAQNDKLIYNGEEIKLWGLNNCYGYCAPEKEMAERRAVFYRKFGFNSLRLHKYADRPGIGIQSEDSFVEFDPDELDQMDYYVHVLKENGIYTKLSPTFGVKFGPGDVHRIPFHRELGNVFERPDKRIRVVYGMVYLSTELQDMQIEQTLKILNHKNPYTGMRYADDPAIFCVEMFNEDAALWYGTNWSLQRVPTIMKRMAGEFSEWLIEKYGSEEEWREAWGDEAILDDLSDLPNSSLRFIIEPEKVQGELNTESLSAGTVAPWGNANAYDNIARTDSDYPELKTRILNTAEFLIGLQNDFYSRFLEAIRSTGYEGVVMASNWQAGSTIGHLLNLHSDHLIGIVDRHNYFGGSRGDLEKGLEFADGSMLAKPGIGTLSAGLQQVDSRPFMLSEWIHEQPNEYYAEGPALLGAYGWGLNGWDVSYIFQNGDEGIYSKKIGRDTWDVTNPALMVNFPAVARQVRRMDVKESERSHFLNAHIPSVLNAELSFYGQTLQNHDIKTFTTDKVPSAALAAERIAVKFTDEYEETKEFDLSPYLEDSTIISSTKQLSWTPAPEDERKAGYFTINTPSTKAFVGFAPGNESFDLGDGYKIEPARGFAVIYLTAKEEDKDLKSSEEIIITVMARARNTGMEFNEEENIILDPGEPPIVLEPVKAIVSVPFGGELELLDHDGNLQQDSKKKFRRKIAIDGAVDQTPYYLLRK
jgi:hypothetical protein